MKDKKKGTGFERHGEARNTSTIDKMFGEIFIRPGTDDHRVNISIALFARNEGLVQCQDESPTILRILSITT